MDDILNDYKFRFGEVMNILKRPSELSRLLESSPEYSKKIEDALYSILERDNYPLEKIKELYDRDIDSRDDLIRKLNDPENTYDIGMKYYNGDGVKKDPEIAKSYFVDTKGNNTCKALDMAIKLSKNKEEALGYRLMMLKCEVSHNDIVYQENIIYLIKNDIPFIPPSGPVYFYPENAVIWIKYCRENRYTSRYDYPCNLAIVVFSGMDISDKQKYEEELLSHKECFISRDYDIIKQRIKAKEINYKIRDILYSDRYVIVQTFGSGMLWDIKMEKYNERFHRIVSPNILLNVLVRIVDNNILVYEDTSGETQRECLRHGISVQ